jgi:hypothetical protein
MVSRVTSWTALNGLYCQQQQEVQEGGSSVYIEASSSGGDWRTSLGKDAGAEPDCSSLGQPGAEGQEEGQEGYWA